MRNERKEVTDPKDLFDIVYRCDTIRLALHQEPFPYLVPLSFGAKRTEESITLYFHCARVGFKAELLANGAPVCVEGDIFYGYREVPGGITACFESFIGYGRCAQVTEDAERLEALRLLCEHCGYADYPLASCKSLKAVGVYKIELSSITGKRSLP